jgi:hypothetical protein
MGLRKETKHEDVNNSADIEITVKIQPTKTLRRLKTFGEAQTLMTAATTLLGDDASNSKSIIFNVFSWWQLNDTK